MALLLGAQLLSSAVLDEHRPQGSLDQGQLDGGASFAQSQDLAPNSSQALAAGLAGLPPLPLPSLPPGDDPLDQALQQYMARQGGSAPLGAAQALGLDAQAEAALARLVLAFVQASELQAEALSGLSPEELALFSGQLDAAAAWQSQHPGATIDDLEAHLMEVAAKADAPKLAQAADLLLRTIDEVRGPLARPPVHAEPPQPAAAPMPTRGTPWETIRSATGLDPGAAHASPSLSQAVAALAAAYGLDPTAVPPLPALLHPTLDSAIAGLVDAHARGIVSGDPAIHAAAVLDAAEQAAPTLQAWEALLSLEARAAHEPDMDALVGSLMGGGASPTALLSAARARPAPEVTPARPLTQLLAPYGLDPREAAAATAAIPPQAAAALALVLEAEALLAATHQDLAEGLPQEASAALLATPSVAAWSDDPAWSAQQAEVIQRWADAVGQLDATHLQALADAQAQAAAAVAAAATLLSSPSSAPPGLPVPVPGAPAPPIPAPCTAGPTSDCPNDVLLELSQGGGILVTGAGRTTINGRFAGGDPHIIIDLGGDDSYTVSAGGAMGGFGVPGNAAGQLITTLNQPGATYVYGPWHQDSETTLDNAQAMRFFAVAIDAAGNDRYQSTSDAAQGAAIGLGTLGMLWDRAGNDVYLQAGGEGDARTFQGSGGSGGLGILVDEWGSDRYEALSGVSQGSGLAPNFVPRVWTCQDERGGTLGVCTGNDRFDREDLAGNGVLADLGEGRDTFTAAVGQGHGRGHGTIGILYDEAGASSYAVEPSSLASQGGHAAMASGFAALIDLGGPGDTYTAPAFPLDEPPVSVSTQLPSGTSISVISAHVLADDWLVVKHNMTQPTFKGDETIWMHAKAGVGTGNLVASGQATTFPTQHGLSLGIDSTLVDEDGDGYANLAELVAGTDAHDAGDSPTDLVTVERIQALVEAALNLTDDRDQDSYPDVVETATGTDPDDPQSTPGPSDPGFLVTVPVLCPETDAACTMPCGGVAFAQAPPSCVSLLSIGGPGATHHRRTAIVELDLQGNDTYSGLVAGPGGFFAGGQARAAGSISLDAGGNDAYDTPTLSGTQAFTWFGASLLLDLEGNDTYRADRQAQGASDGGIAILADFGGNDRYEATAQSQADYTGISLPNGQLLVNYGAASGIPPAGAALVDLRGNDTYATRTQATLRGPVSPRVFAVALDAEGLDRYTLTLDDPSPFAAQGRMEVPTTQEERAAASGRRAQFMDLGDAQDLYFGVVGGATANQTAQKNGAVLHDNPSQAGAAVFSDGLAKDDDGDGYPSLAEALAGSDPTDPASVPVGPGGNPVRLEPGAGTGIKLPGMAISGRGDDVHLTRSDLMVDLGGNDHYLAPYVGGTTPVLHGAGGQPTSATVVVDLGGDDAYRPAACIVEPPALKVSSLRTLEPTPTNDVTTVPGAFVSTSPRGGQAATGPTGASALDPIQLLFCPTLGAAAMGVAVLADQGGENVFEASSRVAFTVDAANDDGSPGNAAVRVRAWGASMGASLFNGAGVLATWEGHNNRFDATLELDVREINSGQADPHADAFALAQGAAYGHGLGLLASTGGTSDTYNVTAAAKAPQATGDDAGRERAYAQGASMGGIGLLLDDGGDNRFLAPSGFAQGHAASLPVPMPPPEPAPRRTDTFVPSGVLWSGPGDDDYLGGGASQGSAGTEFVPTAVGPYDIARPSVGALLDTGGNDAYRLSPAPAQTKVRAAFCAVPLQRACALAQGAADNGGIGLLADWGGDDRHEAQGRTHVQGAGRRGGFGALIDAAGNDLYVADSDGQAFADGGLGKTAAAGGLLADLAGRDSYQLSARGQGYSAGGRPIVLRDILTSLPDLPQPLPTFPFNEGAQFIDIAGLDHYGPSPPKQPVPAAAQRSTDGNDWLWTQRTDSTTSLPLGLGVDAEGIDAAVAAYQATPAPDLATLQVCVRAAAGPCLEADPETQAVTIDGEVEVVVVSDPIDGARLERVSILLDGTLLGVAAPTQDPDTFAFAWDTVADQVRDGRYTIAAVATLSAGPSADAGRGAAAPEGVSLSSGDLAVAVDNAPTGRATLSDDAISPFVPTSHATLDVDVATDLAALGGSESTNVRVQLAPVGQGTPFKIWNASHSAGTVSIPVTGSCGLDCPEGASTVPDGMYTVEVRLTDAGGKVLDLAGMPLLVDGTAPSSVLLMPAIANSDYLVGGADALRAVWIAGDSGSGVKQVVARQVDADGNTVGEPQVVSHPTATATFTGITSGSTVYFVTAAVDWVGNVEQTTAADIVNVTTDFSAPAVRDLAADPPVARPGVNVTLEAVVLDPEDAVDGVFVSGGGAREILSQEMEPTGEERPNGKVYAATIVFENSTDPEGEEEPYVFTVQASDAAGNINPGERQAAILDSRAPRLSLLREVYLDKDQEVPKGRPGALAQFTIASEDYKTAQVKVNATKLGLSDLPCTDQGAGRVWLCSILIPEKTRDGLHELNVCAKDEAGNVANFTVTMTIDVLPPAILNASVTAVGPDYIEVSWNTTLPTTGYVLYGLTPELRGGQTEPSDERVPGHVVRVTGLKPSSKYYLRPVSVSESNAPNLTADLLVETTSDAFTLGFVGFPTFPDWGASSNVTLRVELLQDPSEKVSVILKVQDAQRKSSPLPMASRAVAGGLHGFTLDSGALPDGEYRLVAEGARGGALIRIESPVFRVDNTAPVVTAVAPRPGSIVGQARPVLEVAVIDPLRQDFPDPSSVQVLIDGNLTSVQALRQGNLGAQAKFAIQLPADLTDGLHTVLVRLTDSARNPGEVQWGFQVDSSAPDATVLALRHEGGAPVGRPGGSIQAWLRLNDLSGVSAAALDLRPWGGDRTSMFSHSNGTWSARFTLPTGVPDGRIEIPINATDATGRLGLAGTLPIDIDALAPTLTVQAVDRASLTAVRVQATTDEAATLQVAANGQSRNGTSGTQHALLLDGLTPGGSYSVLVKARDLAGNVVQESFTVTMPADGETPGMPRDVKATPREDGVLLEWAAANDNAGVGHYVVTRIQGETRTDIKVVGATHWLDTGAIAGPVRYRVHAIDVAGLAGAAAEATAFLHVPAQLDEAAITPRQATADRPFTVRVTFTHPAGIEPDAVILHHAGQTFPLARIGDEPCASGCVYGGKFRFPAISTVQPTGPTYLEALVAGVPTRLALEAPLVTASGMAFEEAGPKATPAPSILLALAALAAAFAGRRGGRR